MFDLNDSIYLLTKKKNSYKVYLLSCDREVQNMFALIFNKPLKPGLENGYDEITFQVGYQLSNDEIWKIENFCLPDEIKKAIEHPDTLEKYVPADNEGLTADGYLIKSIFMGKYVNDKLFVAFQKFEKSQVLKRKKYAIVFSSDTFIKSNDFSLNIGEIPDAIFNDDCFKFINYSNANKILPLQEYYRIATQKEIDEFANNDIFELESSDDFVKLTEGQQTRSQIAKILDSKVLEKHDAQSLKNIANQFNIKINVNNNKVTIPKERERLKELLTFLSEKIYKGPLTGKTMISNSTRLKEEEKADT